MAGPQTATIEQNYTQVAKILRAWGWAATGEGRNHIKWRKGDVTVMVRKASGGSKVTSEPLRAAAKVEGLSLHDWMQGPEKPQEGGVADVSEADINFWMSKKFSELDDPEDKARYRNVRSVLTQQGTLEKYQEIKDRQLKEKAEMARVKKQEAEAKEPPQAKKGELPTPDERGYITLEQGLWVRGLFLNEVTRTSAELLATLSRHGTIEDKSGQATAKLLDLMPAAHKAKKPLGKTGMSSLLKAWDDAGLVWREQRGKRTYKIGIVIPVRLTVKQEREYLLPEEKVEPEKDTTPEAPEKVVPHVAAGPVDGSGAMTPADLSTAVSVLRREYDEAMARADALKAAIDILEGK